MANPWVASIEVRLPPSRSMSAKNHRRLRPSRTCRLIKSKKRRWCGQGDISHPLTFVEEKSMRGVRIVRSNRRCKCRARGFLTKRAKQVFTREGEKQYNLKRNVLGKVAHLCSPDAGRFSFCSWTL